MSMIFKGYFFSYRSVYLQELFVSFISRNGR